MKTLFVEYPGRFGILVEKSGRKRKGRALRFNDAVAALKWCERNGSILVYMPAPKVSQN